MQFRVFLQLDIDHTCHVIAMGHGMLMNNMRLAKLVKARKIVLHSTHHLNFSSTMHHRSSIIEVCLLF